MGKGSRGGGEGRGDREVGRGRCREVDGEVGGTREEVEGGGEKEAEGEVGGEGE